MLPLYNTRQKNIHSIKEKIEQPWSKGGFSTTRKGTSCPPTGERPTHPTLAKLKPFTTAGNESTLLLSLSLSLSRSLPAPPSPFRAYQRPKNCWLYSPSLSFTVWFSSNPAIPELLQTYICVLFRKKTSFFSHQSHPRSGGLKGNNPKSTNKGHLCLEGFGSHQKSRPFQVEWRNPMNAVQPNDAKWTPAPTPGPLWIPWIRAASPPPPRPPSPSRTFRSSRPGRKARRRLRGGWVAPSDRLRRREKYRNQNGDLGVAQT